jgi:hypothetical protein
MKPRGYLGVKAKVVLNEGLSQILVSASDLHETAFQNSLSEICPKATYQANTSLAYDFEQIFR